MSKETKYMFKTVGGKYQLSWENFTRKVYSSKKQAINDLQELMVENGCKKKNLRVLLSEDSTNDYVAEVRNRNKSDLENYAKNIPMTGYVFEVDLID